MLPSYLCSEQDLLCFDHFRHKSSPTLGGYYDSTVWSDLILQSCFTHSTVFYAVCAVGAVHRRFELGITPEAFRWCEVSDKMYRRAMQSRETPTSGDAQKPSPEIASMTLLLFSIYEVFQGNNDLSGQYATESFRLLAERSTTVIYSETRALDLQLNPQNLRRLFSTMEFEAMRLFGSVPEDQQVKDPPDPVPREFSSLNQARDVIFVEVKQLWLLYQRAGFNEQIRLSFQQNHIDRILQWSAAYAEHVRAQGPTDRPMQAQKMRQLLKWYREAAYLLLLMQTTFEEFDATEKGHLSDVPTLFSTDRGCRTLSERQDTLNAHFARLSITAESIIDGVSPFSHDEHSLSIDTGLGPPLQLGNGNCCSTKLRHQVQSLLSGTPGHEKVWEKLGVYAILERLTSIEEHAVEACSPLPPSLNAQWLDLTYFLDQRKVLMRYCTPNEKGTGMTWTQTWLKTH